MDDKLRAALLAFPKMPRNEAGDPPVGFTDKGRNYQNAFEFALNEDGRVVQRLVIALDGFTMNRADECGRFFRYEEGSDA